MKHIDTMLSVFQRHSCICQVIIWTPEGPISYASESLIVIFLPWYNCYVYVLNGNKMFLNWKKKKLKKKIDKSWLWLQRSWCQLVPEFYISCRLLHNSQMLINIKVDDITLHVYWCRSVYMFFRNKVRVDLSTENVLDIESACRHPA